MEKFRLPRKIKKSLKGKLWLYPADEIGNSLMAHPAASREDYDALKKGVLRQIPDPKNAKSRRKEYREKLDKEVAIPDSKLKLYINDIIREDLRDSSYYILTEAKKKPKAIVAYYNFINAYQLYEKGDESFGNTCCLAIDLAKDLLKRKKK